MVLRIGFNPTRSTSPCYNTTHACNNTHTKINLSTVKWAQWDKTQSRELLVLFICMCIAQCTMVAHNIAQNRPDNFPSYPPDNHHCSNDVTIHQPPTLVAVAALSSVSTSYMSSAMEQHYQLSEIAAVHPPAWSVDSCRLLSATRTISIHNAGPPNVDVTAARLIGALRKRGAVTECCK